MFTVIQLLSAMIKRDTPSVPSKKRDHSSEAIPRMNTKHQCLQEWISQMITSAQAYSRKHFREPVPNYFFFHFEEDRQEITFFVSHLPDGICRNEADVFGKFSEKYWFTGYESIVARLKQMNKRIDGGGIRIEVNVFSTPKRPHIDISMRQQPYLIGMMLCGMMDYAVEPTSLELTFPRPQKYLRLVQ